VAEPALTRAPRGQVSCFGLGMVALDIRQESTRHSDALDAITNHLGIGSYKCAFLALHGKFVESFVSVLST